VVKVDEGAGHELARIGVPRICAKRIDVHPDGWRIAIVGEDSSPGVFIASLDSEIRTVIHEEVTDVAWNADGSALAIAGGAAEGVRVLDLAGKVLRKRDASASKVVWLRDGRGVFDSLGVVDVRDGSVTPLNDGSLRGRRRKLGAHPGRGGDAQFWLRSTGT